MIATGIRIARRMFNQAVQRGRSERSGEVYSLPYVEPLSDATCLPKSLRRREGTKPADFFNILLAFVIPSQARRTGGATGMSSAITPLRRRKHEDDA